VLSIKTWKEGRKRFEKIGLKGEEEKSYQEDYEQEQEQEWG
jgi:hypothetical protein